MCGCNSFVVYAHDFTCTVLYIVYTSNFLVTFHCGKFMCLHKLYTYTLLCLQRDLDFTVTFNFDGELMDINLKQDYHMR